MSPRIRVGDLRDGVDEDEVEEELQVRGAPLLGLAPPCAGVSFCVASSSIPRTINAPRPGTFRSCSPSSPSPRASPPLPATPRVAGPGAGPGGAQRGRRRDRRRPHRGRRRLPARRRHEPAGRPLRPGGRDAGARLPDLPVAVNHAMAAARGRTLYVAGGYPPDGQGHGMNHAGRGVFALHAAAATAPPGRAAGAPCAPLPAPRAAGGAAIVGDRLYVLAGVRAPGRLAHVATRWTSTGRWRAVAGPPTPPRAPRRRGARPARLRARRPHRRLRHQPAHRRGAGTSAPAAGARWRRSRRRCGGCSATAVAGRVVMVGGEATRRHIPAVQAYDPRRAPLVEPAAARASPATGWAWPGSGGCSTCCSAVRRRGSTSPRRPRPLPLPLELVLDQLQDVEHRARCRSPAPAGSR